MADDKEQAKEQAWGGLVHHADGSHSVLAWDDAACAALSDTGGVCPALKCGKRIVPEAAAVDLTPESARALVAAGT